MPLLSETIVFGNTVSFDVYPSSILGSKFSNVKVIALMDKDTASTWIDPEAMHANVYPTLPATVVDDPSSYQFVMLKHSNGETSVIGLPWIIENSVQVIQKGTLTIRLDNITPLQSDQIVNIISANGFQIKEVTLK